MRIKFQKSAGWLVYMPFNSLVSVENIVKLLDVEVIEVLRNHHRSVVEKKQLDDHYYVVKRPNNKNNSNWIRFTTLYRESEVVRDLKSQLLLDQLTIPSVNPVAALEKRKFGMVVDSVVIYQYRAGIEITTQHYSQMINMMQSLHNNGYLHDDPHTKNFLQLEDCVFAIDCKPRKNYYRSLGIAHNNVSLARRSENPTAIYTLLGKSPGESTIYRFADKLLDLQQIRRGIKNKLKKLLGIEYKN